MQLKELITDCLILIITLLFCAACSADSIPAVAVSDEDQTKNELALELIEQMQIGQFDEAVLPFDGKMQTALPAEKLQQVWQQINTQAGTFQSVLDTSQKNKGGNTTVFAASQFAHTILDIKVSFDQDNQIIGLFFSPSKYKAQTKQDSETDPDLLNVETIEFGDREWRLTGEITYPKSGAKFPLVILVHGSGPNDMDLSIGPNKPFKDIATDLATQGIATLRYNKRTFEHANKYAEDANAINNLTVKEETVDDAILAFEFAQTLNRVDAERIYITGISQGGMLMPRIAQASDAAGYIMLSAPARGLEVLVEEQYNYIFGLDKEISTEEQQASDTLRSQINNLEELNSESTLTAQNLPLGLSKTYWLDLKAYDIVKEAETISKPLLIVQGERDYQVLADKDFKRWTQALSGKDNVTLKLFPKLNHLMMSGENKSIPDEYFQPSTVDSEFISYLADWTKEN